MVMAPVAPPLEQAVPNLMEPANGRIRISLFRRKPKDSDSGTGRFDPPPWHPESPYPGEHDPKCDTCGEQAHHEVVVNEDLKLRLFFCGEHLKQHKPGFPKHYKIHPVRR